MVIRIVLVFVLLLVVLGGVMTIICKILKIQNKNLNPHNAREK